MDGLLILIFKKEVLGQKASEVNDLVICTGQKGEKCGSYLQH
jgi:hypothetical protein